MDLSVITTIATFVIQAIGVGITIRYQNAKLDAQKSQIEGLRTSISDQKASIEALKDQANGQISLTSQQQALTTQMSQLMTSVLTDAEKRLTIVKETAAIEKANIQEKLKQAQTENEVSKQTQLQEVNAINVAPEVTALLKNVIEESHSSKRYLISLEAQINTFFIKSETLLNSIIEIHKAATEQKLNLFPSLTDADKEYIKVYIMGEYLAKDPKYHISINKSIDNMNYHYFKPNGRDALAVPNLYNEIISYAETLGVGRLISSA